MATLSACLVIKNEAATLRRCLESVRDIVDEIVVGIDDTTTDDSEAIARDVADTVYLFTWKDDFSAARNECIHRAHSEYYLSLDGHEFIPEEWVDVISGMKVYPRKALAAVKNRLTAEAIEEVRIQLYNQPFTGWVPAVFFSVPRILHSSIRFHNATHNVAHSADPEKRLSFQDIIVIHDAPEENRRHRKAQRKAMDIRNLRKATRRRRTDSRSWFYLGNTYFGQGMFEESVGAYRQYIKLLDMHSIYHEEYYEVSLMLSGALIELNKYDEARFVLEKVAVRSWYRREALIALGDIAAHAHEQAKAVHFYTMAATTPIAVSPMFQNGPAVTWLPWIKAAQVYKEYGNYHKALACYQKAITYWNNPDWQKQCDAIRTQITQSNNRERINEVYYES